MAETLKQPGIIGETYSHRKTGTKVALLKRREKQKTLLVQCEDGKTRDISYSMFRRDYRKSADKLELTEESKMSMESGPLYETEEEAKEESKEVKKSVKGRKRTKLSEDDKSKVLAVVRDTLDALTEEGARYVVKERANSAVVLRYGRKGYVEFWPLTAESVYIACDIDLWDNFIRTHLPEDVLKKAEFHEKWNLKIKVNDLSLDGISDVCDVITKHFSEFLDVEFPMTDDGDEEDDESEAEG